MKIDSFDGEHRFLSNFYPAAVTMYGQSYPTTEHAFQAAKTEDLAQRERIRLAATPGIAKRLGRSVTLRPGWNELRLGVMSELLRRKFTIPELRWQLLATGDAELIEGNYWNDRFWGVCRGQGENHLGRLLMELRKELA